MLRTSISRATARLRSPVLRFGRTQVTSTTGGANNEMTDPVNEIEPSVSADNGELYLMKQKELNDEIVKGLKQLSNTPLKDVEKYLNNAEKSDLSEKEMLLEQELTKFLKKYSQDNQLLSDISDKDTTSRAVEEILQTKRYPYLVPSSNDKPYTQQELYLRQIHHATHSAKLGARVEKVFSPYRDIYTPPTPEKVSLEKLMAAGVHLGQSTSLWRSSTQPYIYGEYKGIHIIDLKQTLSHLKRAAQVVEGVAERGGVILYLGTRSGQKLALEEAAKKTHGYYVSTRWIPGTLTNSTEISGIWEKHEVDFSDMPTGRQLHTDENSKIVKPDLLVVLNPTENRNALNEAMKTRIPTIGIVDTDSEPSFLTYPIPGNDDSLRSVNLLLGVLVKAGERGLRNRIRKASKDQS